MNCLEFRQRLASDPNDRDPAFQAHVRDCAVCGARLRREAVFDQRLRAAVDVPVPDNLRSRILLGQSMTAGRRQRWLALAASVVLAVGLTAGGWWMSRPTPLSQVVLDHIAHEPQSLVIREDIYPAQLDATLRRLGASAKPALGRVDYLSVCKIRKANGAHLVLDGARGPVTVLLMPGEYIHERVSFKNERFEGVLFPARAGSVAVVVEHGEPLSEFERRVQETVTF